MSDTLFEQLGGEAAVDAAVDIFYRKVLADKRINKFFEGVDMEKQARKQKAFMTMAFGGPNNYTGEDMRKGHAHMVKNGLDDSHFDAVAENLVASLKELKVSDKLIKGVVDIVESTRDDVLGKEVESSDTAASSSSSSSSSSATTEDKSNAWLDYMNANKVEGAEKAVKSEKLGNEWKDYLKANKVEEPEKEVKSEKVGNEWKDYLKNSGA